MFPYGAPAVWLHGLSLHNCGTSTRCCNHMLTSNPETFSLIEASWSEPHTSDVNRNFSVYIYIIILYICRMAFRIIHFFYSNDLQYFNTTINVHALWHNVDAMYYTTRKKGWENVERKIRRGGRAAETEEQRAARLHRLRVNLKRFYSNLDTDGLYLQV